MRSLKKQGEHFHEVFKKRRKLRQEFKEAVGKAWREGKSEGAEDPATETVSLVALREAIEKGEAVSIPAHASDPKTERALHLRHTLRALDRAAAKFKPEDRAALQDVARPEHRVEARDRGFEQRYEKVSSELGRLRVIRSDMDRKEFALLRERRTKLSSVDLDLIKQYQEVRGAVALREARLRTDPETTTPARMFELRSYNEQLAKDRYAETPSRVAYEADVQRLWEEGKNVLLTGPTGTGKTEMIEHLGKKLLGRVPEKIRCTERTGPSDIFGKLVLKAQEGATVSPFKPGPYVRAIEEGNICLFDEFNNMATTMRMGLKELYNRKPGDLVKIQEDGDQTIQIKEGFAFAATANLRTEKYKERFELDPAESRVFEMRRIDYLPKDELYDLCLATLMDSHGRVHASRADASETLKRLTEATEQIQQAFLGVGSFYEEEGGGTKKKWVLEKAVLDPGKVLSMLGGWQAAEARGGSFDEYLNDQLRDFLNKEDFPEKDRALLLKVFLTKGFFAGRDPKEFHTNLTPAKLRTMGLKEEKTPTEANVDPLRPSEVALLDPFEKRKAELAQIADEFLKDEFSRIPYEEGGKEYKPGALLAGKDGKVFRYLGVTKEGKPVLAPFAGKLEAGAQMQEAFEELIERERTSLRDFFGKDIDVPAVPNEVTPKQYEQWKQMGLEMHYLPPKEMTEDKGYPGWKKRPTSSIDLLKAVQDSKNKLAPDTLKLPGAWVVVEAREKPQYQNGNQMYQNDPFLQAIGELQGQKVLGSGKGGSRYQISWEELHKPEVKTKLAEVLGTTPDQLRMPRAIEWNFLGNAHYPKWGDTNTWEWLEDSYQDSGHLFGGQSDYGGLSVLGCAGLGARSDNTGFRLLIVFP